MLNDSELKLEDVLRQIASRGPLLTQVSDYTQIEDFVEKYTSKRRAFKKLEHPRKQFIILKQKKRRLNKNQIR